MFLIRNKVAMMLTVEGVDISSGQAVVNVLHVRSSDPGAAYGFENLGSSSTTLLNAFRTAWLDVIVNLSEHLIVSQYNLKEITGHFNGNLLYGSQDFRIADGDGDAGGLPGEACPAYVAASVQKKTATAGRSFRGGMRLGPIPESSNENGSLEPDNRAGIQTAADILLEGFIIGGAGPNAFIGVFSRTIGLTVASPWTSSDAFFKPVTAMPVSRNTGSQVSRKPRLNTVIDPAA